MKLLCPSCQHVYHVPESVVDSGLVRFPCRVCGAVVDGVEQQRLERLDDGALTSGWFVVRDGRFDGPHTTQSLLEAARGGALSPSALLWRQEKTRWDVAAATPPFGPDIAGGSRWWLKVPSADLVAQGLESFLNASPGHQPTQKALLKIIRSSRTTVGTDSLLAALEAEGPTEDLLALLEELCASRSREQRTAARRRLAQVVRAQLGDIDRSVELLMEAFSDSPVEPGLLEELDLAARDAGLQSEVAALLDSVLRDERAGARQSSVVQLLARTQMAIGRVDLAAVTAQRYRGVIAPRLAMDIFRRANLYAPLADTIEVELRSLPEGQRDDLKAELAALFSEHLDRPRRGVELWTEILSRDAGRTDALRGLEAFVMRNPGEQDARRALIDVYGQLGLWEEQLAQKLALARSVQPAMRAEVFCEAADLAMLRLGDLQRGLDYLVDAAGLGAGGPDAVARIAERLDGWGARASLGLGLGLLVERSPALAGSVLNELDTLGLTVDECIGVCRRVDEHRSACDSGPQISRYLASAERWEELVEHLEDRLAGVGVDHRMDELIQLIEALLGPLDRPARAHAYLERLSLVIDWRSPHLETYAALAGKAGLFMQSVQAWRHLAESAEVGTEAEVRCVRAIAFNLDKLGDAQAAADAWFRLFGVSPSDADARARLRVLLPALERWDQYAEVLGVSLEGCEGQARVQVLLELADVWGFRLQEPHLAQTYLSQAERAGATWATLHRSRGELLRVTEDWMGLVGHLEGCFEQAGTEERIDFALEACLVSSLQLRDRVRAARWAVEAMSLGAEVAQMAPYFEPAAVPEATLRSAAECAIESAQMLDEDHRKLVALWCVRAGDHEHGLSLLPESSEDAECARLRCWSALARGDWQTLASLLEGQARPPSRSLQWIYGSKLAEPSRALDWLLEECLESAIAPDPERIATCRLQLELFARWHDVIRLLRGQADRANAQERGPLLEESYRIYREHIDEEHAVTALRELLDSAEVFDALPWVTWCAERSYLSEEARLLHLASQRDGVTPDLLRRLAELHGHLGDQRARRENLSALVALGAADAAQLFELCVEGDPQSADDELCSQVIQWAAVVTDPSSDDIREVGLRLLGIPAELALDPWRRLAQLGSMDTQSHRGVLACARALGELALELEALEALASLGVDLLGDEWLALSERRAEQGGPSAADAAVNAYRVSPSKENACHAMSRLTAEGREEEAYRLSRRALRSEHDRDAAFSWRRSSLRMTVLVA